MRRSVLVGVLIMASGVLAQEPRRGEREPEARVDLAAEVSRTLSFVRDRQAFRADTAASYLRHRFDELIHLSPDAIDAASIDRDPHGLVQRLFELTLALDERLAELHAAGELSDELADAKRRALRGIRFVRDQVLLRTAAAQPGRLYEHGKPRLAELHPRQHWSVAPGWEGKGLQDLPRTFAILCAGGSAVSAGIARSAAEDTMFSHFAIGYRSEREHVIEEITYPAGSLFIIEALIEHGVVIRPLERHFDSTVRDVLFVVRDRSQQPALDREADAFFEQVKARLAAGDPLPYDFSMGSNTGLTDALAGSRRLDGRAGQLPAYFCSGVGADLFGAVGIRLFTHMTRMQQGPETRRLFEAWGIDPAKKVPAPGDADVSPALLRIAEGTVIDQLEQAHVMHVVLSEMFRWMDEEGWQLRMPWYGMLGTRLLGTLNDGPLDLGLIPRGVDTDILRTMGALDRGAKQLSERLTAENAAFRQARGRSMTPPEMAVRLREVRLETKGLRRWFRPAPRALGRFELETGRGGSVVLLVRQGQGLRYEVERVERDRQGQLISRARGSARQWDEELTLALSEQEPPRSTWSSMRYTLDLDGSIRLDAIDPQDEERGRRGE